VTQEWLDKRLVALMVLRRPPDDTSGYLEVLQDVPQDYVEGAIRHALKSRSWYPTPAELLSDCDVVAARDRKLPVPEWPTPEQLAEAEIAEIRSPYGVLRVRVVREWHDECTRCGDTGWAEFWCGEGQNTMRHQEGHCGRRRPHSGHSWVEPCFCRPTNRTYQRRIGALASYAQGAKG
jgi:hypothetical protein